MAIRRLLRQVLPLPTQNSVASRMGESRAALPTPRPSKNVGNLVTHAHLAAGAASKVGQTEKPARATLCSHSLKGPAFLPPGTTNRGAARFKETAKKGQADPRENLFERSRPPQEFFA